MKTLFPYNLQTFADGESQDGETAEETRLDDKSNDGAKSEPSGTPEPEVSTQELLTRIAKLERAKDKANSEAAEWKKKFRATQSEQEKADAEKAEEQAKRDEEFEFYKRKDKIHETEKAYLKLGYTPDEAERIAIAEADNDFDAKTKIMAEVDERKKKELEAEFIKNRPDINAGSGGKVLTKEQFDGMDIIERSKLRKDDPETYNRMLGIK